MWSLYRISEAFLTRDDKDQRRYELGVRDLRLEFLGE